MNLIYLSVGCLYIIFLYYLPLLSITFPGTFVVFFGRIFGFAMFLCILLEYKQIQSFISKKLYIYIYAILILFVLIFLINIKSLNLLFYINGFYEIFSCFVVVIFFSNLCLKYSALKLVTLIVLLCSFGNASVGIYGAMTGERLLNVSSVDVGFGSFGFDPATGRSGGIRGENYAALWNAPLIIYSLSMIFNRKKIFIFVGCLLFALSIISVLVSFSRGSILALIFMVLAYLYQVRINIKIYHFVFLVLFFVLVLFISYEIISDQLHLAPKSTLKYLEDKWLNRQIMNDIRTSIWSAYISNMQNFDLIFGKGPGSIKTIAKSQFYIPHNSFIDVFIEYGLYGLTLYSALYYKIIKFVIFNRNLCINHISIYTSVFVGMAVSLLFLSNPFLKIVWVFYGICLGLIISNSNFQLGINRRII